MRLASLAGTVLLVSTLCYAQTPQLGRITGIVLNEDGQPMVHAAACISASGSSKTECNVFSDEGGHFEIQHLASGTFFVFATKEEDGYSGQNQGRGQRVVLNSEGSVANVTIKLAPKSGTLIGTVRDSVTGKRVDRIRIMYVASDGGSTGSAGPYMGEFRFNLRTASDFVIVVSAPGYKPWVYTDPADGPSLHLASGEQKSLAIELVPKQ
jgi:hypothetical protein